MLQSAVPDGGPHGLVLALELDVVPEAVGGVAEGEIPGGGAGALAEEPMRVGGEDGEDGAEGLVGEVVGEPGLDDGQGGAGIEQQGSPPERAEQRDARGDAHRQGWCRDGGAGGSYA